MKVTCSSETTVDFQRTTRLFIPEGRTIHNHRCENLRKYLPVIKQNLEVENSELRVHSHERRK
jgi:hypothetical protein